MIALLLAFRVWLPVAGAGASIAASPGPPAATTTATASPTATATATATTPPTASRTSSPTASATATAGVVMAPFLPEPAAAAALPATSTTTTTVTTTTTSTTTATGTTTTTVTTTVTTTTTATPIATATPPPLAVVVLAGQSNMQPGNTSTRPSVPEDALIAWTAGNAHARLLDASIEAADGPALSMARTIARAGGPVALVGCGVGGTGILEWQRGEAPYDTCVALVRSLAVPPSVLAFAQGEADTWTDGREAPQVLADGVTLRDPHHWGEDFAAFVTHFRADVGQPDLPVVFVRTAHLDYPVGGRDNLPTVQAAQDAVAIPGVIEVPSEPAVLIDGVHYDQATYDQVGARLGEAWLHRTSPP